jgi:ATP-binding cassette, subfamily C (CFTR/MRP), member 1
VNRSPLYALLGETIDGVATIRAFSAQQALTRRLISSLDLQQHAYYLTSSSLCWLAVRLEIIGTVIIAFACCCSIFNHDTINGDEVLAGLYGLSISYALSVTGALNWSVRMASDCEALLVSVERIEEYCKLESEADRHTAEDQIAEEQGWPSEGQIDFVDAQLRYRPNLPLALKGLNIHIPASSRVGVVGRTGKFIILCRNGYFSSILFLTVQQAPGNRL